MHIVSIKTDIVCNMNTGEEVTIMYVTLHAIVYTLIYYFTVLRNYCTRYFTVPVPVL